MRACDPSVLIVAGFPRSGSAGALGIEAREVSAGGDPAGGTCAVREGTIADDNDTRAASAHESGPANM